MDKPMAAKDEARASKDRLRLAALFRKLGFAGLWVQLAIAALVIVFGALLMTAGLGEGTPGPSGVVGYLAIGSLPILAFTIVWFWRYCRIGARLRDNPEKVDLTSLSATVWIGIAASGLGVCLSIIVILIEMAYLLMAVLGAPQAGFPVIQNAQESNWISAFDIFGIMALTLELTAEVVVLLFGLWLLFHTSQFAPSRRSPSQFSLSQSGQSKPNGGGSVPASEAG